MGYGRRQPMEISKPKDVFSTMCAFLIVTSDQAENGEEAARKLAELSSLCCTVGAKVAGQQYLKIRQFNSAIYIGTGQAERIREQISELGCNIVVFNNSISPRIQRNLEQVLETCVVDRQEIILQIFANRATTREARLQVELAQLEYSLPRLTRKWANLSQQRGGVKGSKGSGEKQLELDRRQAKQRIVRLKREISQIDSQRLVQRKNRIENSISNIAIVGYTNSGKSTLLNRISNAGVLSQDMLFATLDTTTRKVRLPGGTYTLLTDTVGFVSDLPHELVDAFRSTLEEASLSDLLLIVLDASSEDLVSNWNTTLSVLEELGASGKPRLVLLNKMDLVHEQELDLLRSFEATLGDCLEMSVTTDASIEQLLVALEKKLTGKAECQVVCHQHPF